MPETDKLHGREISTVRCPARICGKDAPTYVPGRSFASASVRCGLVFKLRGTAGVCRGLLERPWARRS